jgi:predicted glycoside hydrolase/deacetylase ChbG (UPF0249 family)
MKRLIVNGDDFGWTTAISKGILKAHHDGVLTSTTMIVNSPGFDEAVALAKETSALGVGLHLNVTHGSPVSDRDKIPSLLDASGNFLGGDAFCIRLFRGSIDPVELRREVDAQLMKFQSALGNPTHLDSHKHVHVFGCYRRVAAELAGALEHPRIRCPVERFRATSILRPLFACKLLMLQVAGQRARRRFHEAGFRMADAFMGVSETGRLTAEACVGMLSHLHDGVTELMCHPGLAVENESDAAPGDRLTESRPLELKAVTNGTVQECIAQQHIELVNYRSL